MVVLYIIVGILGGMLGGMGMGGGTLLVPMSVYLLSMEQKTAQFLNLAAFLPMGAVALSCHVANGLTDFKKAAALTLSGIAAAILGSALQKSISADNLTKCFGLFLAAIGALTIFQKK